MKIFVSSKPNTKKAHIEKIDDAHYVVAIKERPVKGRANTAIARAIAKHLNVPLSDVRLMSGTRSKRKMFEIL